jgi:hypothetical protein
MLHYECERIVEDLQEIDIRNYGSIKWIKQHHTCSKLNLQSHINMISRGDEFVMESLATFDKIKVLIHGILCSEIWKEKV